MEIAVRGMALITVAAVLGMVLRPYHGSLSVVLSLAACAAAAMLALKFVEPALEMTNKLRKLSGLSVAVTAPLIKTAGIGILGQCAMGVCEDAGEKSLSKTVEILVSACCVYINLPLLQAVLELLEDLLGG